MLLLLLLYAIRKKGGVVFVMCVHVYSIEGVEEKALFTFLKKFINLFHLLEKLIFCYKNIFCIPHTTTCNNGKMHTHRSTHTRTRRKIDVRENKNLMEEVRSSVFTAAVYMGEKSRNVFRLRRKKQAYATSTPFLETREFLHSCLEKKKLTHTEVLCTLWSHILKEKKYYNIHSKLKKYKYILKFVFH